MDTYGKFMRFNVVSLVGGMPYHNQIRDLARGADIIVATPGRLMDHMEQKRIDLSEVSMLILDEADRMLDMGFIDDVQYIAKLTPSKRQTLLFSATLDTKLMNAVKHLLKNPVRIDLSHEKIASPQILQEMYRANNIHHKTRLLRHFLNDKNIFKAIIFSSTKVNADRLTDQLCDDGFSAAALHGDLRQNVRTRTLEQLRRGKIQYLVATDVAARGIDISDITHVINFDLPRFCEDYVHRIGRTGRAGKTGTAISFVLPTEMHLLKNIERYTGQRMQVIQSVDMSSSEGGSSSAGGASLNKDCSLDDERPRRSHNSDRPERSSRSDRGDRSERSARPDRGDRPERSFKSDRSDRPVRSFNADRGDKPARSFKSDRGDRPERSSRPDRGDRPERSFSSDRSERPARSFKSDRGDRPERSFKSDRGDRPVRSFDSDRSDRPARSFKSDRGDRPIRSFHSDRDEKPARSFSDRGDRPARSFKSDRGDRPVRSFNADRGDKPTRSFKSDRGDKPVRSFKSDRSDKPARTEFKEGYRAKSKIADKEERSARKKSRTSEDHAG
jgi:superfamily II DNA/RNA helicase